MSKRKKRRPVFASRRFNWHLTSNWLFGNRYKHQRNLHRLKNDLEPSCGALRGQSRFAPSQTCRMIGDKDRWRTPEGGKVLRIGISFSDVSRANRGNFKKTDAFP